MGVGVYITTVRARTDNTQTEVKHFSTITIVWEVVKNHVNHFNTGRGKKHENAIWFFNKKFLDCRIHLLGVQKMQNVSLFLQSIKSIYQNKLLIFIIWSILYNFEICGISLPKDISITEMFILGVFKWQWWLKIISLWWYQTFCTILFLCNLLCDKRKQKKLFVF